MIFSHTSHRQLRKLPANEALQVVYALLQCEKKPQGYIKWLENRPGYRIRIGKYRVIFEHVFENEDEKLLVLDIRQEKD